MNNDIFETIGRIRIKQEECKRNIRAANAGLLIIEQFGGDPEQRDMYLDIRDVETHKLFQYTARVDELAKKL